jgi:hypothetical protein
MRFRGLTSLNTTPVPDDFFDVLLARIDNLAELKVILYVIRRTFGFGKVVDRISYSQFERGIKTTRGSTEVQLDRGTGLSRPSIVSGLKKALAHGYLIRYIICPHCGREVSQPKEEEGLQGVLGVTPQRCPHCNWDLRGRGHFYYGVPLSSTHLSTLGNDIAHPRLRSFTGGGKHSLPAPVKPLNLQETVKQETDNKKQYVVEALSAFGFGETHSLVIAEEALNAGLGPEDVTGWIDYVRRQKALTNPRGFLRSRLRSGERPPAGEADRYRYIHGEYADYIKH